MITQKAEKPYPSDIRQLTALRFFAAFAIVIFHFRLAALPLDKTYGIPGLAEKAYLAVDFFFILSGFILSHAYLNEAGSMKTGLKDFYIKRLARIYPVHFVTLLLSAGVTTLLFLSGFLAEWPERHTIKSFFFHLFLLHGWGVEGNLSYNLPSWSISTEWFAYLLFPSLVLMLNRVGLMKTFQAAVCLFILLWFLFSAFWIRPLTETTFDLSILRILPEFMLGMVLYRFGSQNSLRFYNKFVFMALVTVIVVIAHSGLPDICIVPLLAILILLAAEQARQSHDWFLSGRVAVYLGKISYSVYMIHFLVFYAVFMGTYMFMGAEFYKQIIIPLWLAGYVSVFAASMLLYHFIERPAHRAICRKFL